MTKHFLEQSMSALESMRGQFGRSSAFHPTGGEVSTIGGRWVRRRGSVAASIRSVHEILWKDDRLKSMPGPAPPARRRSARVGAWKVVLGLWIDLWGGRGAQQLVAQADRGVALLSSALVMVLVVW